MKVVAVIPGAAPGARARESLRPLGGRPLIEHAIRAALDAAVLDEVYVHSESEEIEAVARALGARFLPLRPDLAGERATLDEQCHDALQRVEADWVVRIDPGAALLSGRDIDAAVEHFRSGELDTLLAVRDERAHAFGDAAALASDPALQKSFAGHVPLNFDARGRLPLARSTALVRVCAWTLCVWRRETFLRSFAQSGAGVLSGRVGFFAQHPICALRASSELDFHFAEILLRAAELAPEPRIPYDSARTLGPHAPAMWLAEIDYIERALLAEGRRSGRLCVVGWGGGDGALHFARRLREQGIAFHWDVVESYTPSYLRLAERVRAENLGDEVHLHLCNGSFEDRAALQEQAEMREFVELPLHRGCVYDVALVAGRKRAACLEMAARVLRPSGLALLRNAERPDAHAAFRHYRGGEFVVETPSPVPGGLQKLWAGHAA
jgi:hypothetical protein